MIVEQFFVFTMVVPGVMLVLLLLPLPNKAQNVLVAITDKVLYLRPHPYVNLSLFWINLLVSLAAFAYAVFIMENSRKDYVSAKHKGGIALEQRVRLLAAERNLWITGCSAGLWILLHRFRTLQKRYNTLYTQVAETKAK
ncbi:Hypothetical Protein FCC1311_028202 [Hondaea fermentalgiana]|uniref:BAP29/BAP31 transmembrane domain-containing protein n=1 Tax=Hondaea fermentalgiana TaxID=2315210 RepID=A0A2R5G8F0_9STRA|nr:Hypothetical Protein FCC1311_028202 [Hondaea fermentalgiana]|eukprot:GBG26599.1 Hypothetical Protein FCC1311_028202 [Hondaea fermentalgiana]